MEAVLFDMTNHYWRGTSTKSTSGQADNPGVIRQKEKRVNNIIQLHRGGGVIKSVGLWILLSIMIRSRQNGSSTRGNKNFENFR